jgi:hypothetical protein
METPSFKPKRGSLITAVETSLGRFIDKSAEDVRLKAMTKEEWKKRGIGDSMVVPFQEGATDHCYALELVFCDENHPLAVSVQNYAYSKQDIEKWADDLWRLWDEAEDENADY